MKLVKSIALFFQEGSSDKVYNAKLVEEDDGTYSVHVEWGRRGSRLSTGAKAVKVTLEKAQKQYDSLVREKTGKGYQEITAEVAPAEVAPPVGQGSGSRVGGAGRKKTGQAAQLLNAIEEDDLERLFKDANVVAQQKLDGVRVLVHVRPGEIIASNRGGEVMELASQVVAAVRNAPENTILDGELVRTDDGPQYWVFDLLVHGTEDLRGLGYLERYAELDALAEELPAPVRLVRTARTEQEKRALFAKLTAERAEGIVFKKGDAPYTPGRPASGGAQLKYKFVKSADVFLTENAGNAYQMAVYDQGKVRLVGKVFAGTTNESRKELDELLAAGERPVVEVRYLYATDDDILYQPVFAQRRDDKAPEDCSLTQLVRTNREVLTG